MITLTCEQYDICWADLNLGEHVYPLRIRSHGRTYPERAHLRRQVYQQLEASGLARGERLEPELHDALALLARAPVGWTCTGWLSRNSAARAGPSRPAQVIMGWSLSSTPLVCG